MDTNEHEPNVDALSVNNVGAALAAIRMQRLPIWGVAFPGKSRLKPLLQFLPYLVD